MLARRLDGQHTCIQVLGVSTYGCLYMIAASWLSGCVGSGVPVEQKCQRRCRATSGPKMRNHMPGVARRSVVISPWTAIMPPHRLARFGFDAARACRGVVGSFDAHLSLR
jgi:hypothetical protein